MAKGDEVIGPCITCGLTTRRFWNGRLVCTACTCHAALVDPDIARTRN